jgi:hypothetical protein
MAVQRESISGDVEGVRWEVRPEWLAGRYWWRVYVGGHPKVLMRNRDYAVQAAEPLAADEAEYRREAGWAPQ